MRKNKKFFLFILFLFFCYVLFFLYSNIDLSKKRDFIFYEKFFFGKDSFIEYNCEIVKGAEPLFLNKSNETVVLLLHGLGGTPIEMKELGEFLGEKNFSVVIPLLPYQGRDYNSIKKLDIDSVYLEVEKIYNYLKKDYNNVYVGGLSTGGSLSLKLAENHEVKGVISLSTPIFYGYKFLGDSTLYFFKIMKIITPNLRRIEYGLARDKNVKKKLPSFDRLPTRVLLEGEKLRIETKNNLYKIYSPILIIQSKFDNRATPYSAEYIYKNVNSKEKKLVYLNNSGHVITMDYDKEIVFKEVSEFIK